MKDTNLANIGWIKLSNKFKNMFRNMLEIKAKTNLSYVQDDSLFPNINEVVFNKTQALEAIKLTAIDFGYKLWQYLPSGDTKGNPLFQNPETGETFTIEQLYDGEDGW